MAPKSQKSGAGGRRSGEEEKEEAFQAVVIADTFESKFIPFTREKPRCLLPLCNTPLIEYTLEYLAASGVHEVYMYSGAHTDLVEAYIDASKWRLPTSPFKKFVFLKSAATSVGDVMRDLDQKNIIAGDFLCVSGDIVSNFPIELALKQHKARREKDKNAIMTMVLREAGRPRFPIRSSILPLFVIDPVKDRCLHYEEADSNETFGGHIDPEVLGNAELEITQDLIDCRIDICTPDVLSLWSDNFDNQSPRKDFLHGVLKDYELNGKTFHTYIVKKHYAARVSDLLAYDRISRDIKQRWCTPLSVENNLFAENEYRTLKQGVLVESDVILARSSRIEGRTTIGKGTSVGAGSRIHDTVIGRRCQIGKNVELDGAYIWDDVTISNNAKILKSIVASEAFIGEACTIEEGALVAYGVHLASSRTVSAGEIVTKASDDDGDEDAESRAPGLVYNRSSFSNSVSSLASDESDFGSEAAPPSTPGSRSESFAASDSFHQEAVNSLYQRMQEGTKADDVQVELMGLRFAEKATEDQVRRAVAVAITKHIQQRVDSGASPADASKQTLEKYRVVVQRDNSQETVENQADFLLQAQKDLIHRKDGAKILLFLSKDLYDLEVFPEEVFTEWWGGQESQATEELVKVREPTAQFINFLETASSESGSEEDEDD